MDTKKQRASTRQMEMMVEFLEKNPIMVAYKASKEDKNKKWEELTLYLNSVGLGANRDALKWRKCWADMKCNTRAKAVRLLKHGSITGDSEKLSAIENRILGVIESASSMETEDMEEVRFESWNDQKFLIKAKAVKRDEYKATGNDDSYELSDLEERVLNLIHDHEQKRTSKSTQKKAVIKKDILKIDPKVQNDSQETSYIVLGIGEQNGENVPVTLQPVKQTPLTLGTANVLFGIQPQNIVLSGLQSSSTTPVKEAETSILISSCTSEMNKSQNINNIQKSLDTSTNSSEVQTENFKESGEKEKTSALIPKLTSAKDSENFKISATENNTQEISATENNSQEISAIENNSQDPSRPEEILKNVMNSSVLNSSMTRAKRRKLNHQSAFRTNENELATLLQRQNRILEGIAGTLERIEKSVKDRESVEVQRKNNIIFSISENIERLAESLCTVSKSLKSVADN